MLRRLCAAATGALGDPGAVINIASGTQTTLSSLVGIARRVLHVETEPVWGSMAARGWDTSIWVGDPALAASSPWAGGRRRRSMPVSNGWLHGSSRTSRLAPSTVRIHERRVGRESCAPHRGALAAPDFEPVVGRRAASARQCAGFSIFRLARSGVIYPLCWRADGTLLDVGCGAQPYRGLLPLPRSISDLTPSAHKRILATRCRTS